MTGTDDDPIVSMRPDGIETVDVEDEQVPSVPEAVADPISEPDEGWVLGARLQSLGPPAQTALTALPASARNPRRLHQGIPTDQLRADLTDLVRLADCTNLDLGFRVVCAVEARHVMAHLLARARHAGFEGSGSGLPEVTYDDGAVLER